MSLETKVAREIADGEAGVSGIIDSIRAAFGSPAWIKKQGFRPNSRLEEIAKNASKNGLGCSLLSYEGRVIALFTFINDDHRAGADTLVKSLRANKMEVQILSGDQQDAVEKFGSSLGIPPSKCRGGVTPEEKAKIVDDLTNARVTLMAGDGFNDSGALAAASVGIAMGSGEQINLEAADVLIPGQDPMTIAKLVQISKRTRKRVSFNIAISMTVTAVLVLTTMFGINSSIAIGIALHEASVFIVILNGMLVKDSGESPTRVVKSVLTQLTKDIFDSFAIIKPNLRNPATTS